VSTQQDNPLASFGTNEWIVEEMYQKYLSDPASVDPAWHDFFADYKPAVETPVVEKPAAPAPAPVAEKPKPATAPAAEKAVEKPKPAPAPTEGRNVVLARRGRQDR
jgi:2-oxoglutarate dehydrogenase E1 component